jgi:NAD(P)-dependent dehydrogenase (short-subunit alcohol dehydrogenase family)
MSIFDRFSLRGKTLFITGGSRGLGREMALAIADAGADVILTGRNPDDLDQTAAEIRNLGRNAETVTADLGDPERCEAVCRQILEDHGPVHRG